MPRGVKRKINFEEELAELNQKIAKHKQQLANLENRKKILLSSQKSKEAERLMDFLVENEMSIDDMISQLSPS